MAEAQFSREQDPLDQSSFILRQPQQQQQHRYHQAQQQPRRQQPQQHFQQSFHPREELGQLQIQQHQLQLQQHLVQQQQLQLQLQQDQLIQQLMAQQQNQFELQLRRQKQEHQLPNVLRSMLDSRFDRTVQVFKKELGRVESKLLSQINRGETGEVTTAVQDQLLPQLAVLSSKADQSEDLSTSILTRLAALETSVAAICQHLGCAGNQPRTPGQTRDTQSGRSSRVQSPLPEQQHRLRSPSPGQQQRMQSPSPGQQQRMQSPSPGQQQRMQSPSPGQQQRMQSPSPGQQQRMQSPSPGQQQRMQSPSPGQQQRMQSSSPVRQQRMQSPSLKYQVHEDDEERTDPKTVMVRPERETESDDDIAHFFLRDENTPIDQGASRKSERERPADRNPHTLERYETKPDCVPNPMRSSGHKTGASSSLALHENPPENAQPVGETYPKKATARVTGAPDAEDNALEEGSSCPVHVQTENTQHSHKFLDASRQKDSRNQGGIFQPAVGNSDEKSHTTPGKVAGETSNTGDVTNVLKPTCGLIPPRNQTKSSFKMTHEISSERQSNSISSPGTLQSARSMGNGLETQNPTTNTKRKCRPMVKSDEDKLRAVKDETRPGTCKAAEDPEKNKLTTKGYAAADKKEKTKNTSTNTRNGLAIAANINETEENKPDKTVAADGFKDAEEKAQNEVTYDDESEHRESKEPKPNDPATAPTATKEELEDNKPSRKFDFGREKSSQSLLQMSLSDEGNRQYTWDLFLSRFSTLINSGVEISSSVLHIEPLHVQGSVCFLQGGVLQVWFAICKVDKRTARHHSEGEGEGFCQKEGKEMTKVRLHRARSEDQTDTSSQTDAGTLSKARVKAALVDPKNRLCELVVGHTAEVEWHERMGQTGRWAQQQYRLGLVSDSHEVISSGYTRVGTDKDTAVLRYTVELIEK